MPEIAIAELEDFALELAHTAGGIAQAHFRQPVTVENKGTSSFDPVTNADRAIERVLRTAIEARYPEHGIVAEEEGERRGKSPYTWYIDPIDGTRNFAARNSGVGTQAMSVPSLRTRMNSAERKKCALFWTIGPPSENPG